MKNLERICTKFNLIFFNIIIILLGFLLFSFTLSLTKNYIVLFLDLLLLVLLTYNERNNKYIRFITDFSIIYFLASWIISLLVIPVYSMEIKGFFLDSLKFLLFILYLVLVIVVLQKIKKESFGVKKYTLNKLRKDNIYIYKNRNIKKNKQYIENQNILNNSNEYEILKDNLLPKTKDNLEDYVRLEYLRFYKNRNSQKIWDFTDEEFIFLIIHVIILVLAIFVR